MSCQPTIAPVPGTHLTDDEVDEVLLDMAEPGILAHLALCQPCQARVNQFTDALGHFNAATLRWAEAKSSTLPLVRPQQPRTSLSWQMLPACAAALAMAGALWLGMRSPATPPTQDTTLAEAEPDAAQLARDNAMLAAIHLELDPGASPLERRPAGTLSGTAQPELQ